MRMLVYQMLFHSHFQSCGPFPQPPLLSMHCAGQKDRSSGNENEYTKSLERAPGFQLQC